VFRSFCAWVVNWVFFDFFVWMFCDLDYVFLLWVLIAMDFFLFWERWGLIEGYWVGLKFIFFGGHVFVLYCLNYFFCMVVLLYFFLLWVGYWLLVFLRLFCGWVYVFCSFAVFGFVGVVVCFDFYSFGCSFFFLFCGFFGFVLAVGGL